jgi:hypothetical protein
VKKAFAPAGVVGKKRFNDLLYLASAGIQKQKKSLSD